jgi:hypothetical protein
LQEAELEVHARELLLFPMRERATELEDAVGGLVVQKGEVDESEGGLLA